MKKFAQFTILAGLVTGLATIPAFPAQAQQSAGQQAQQQSGSQAKPAAVKPNPAEEKAYKAFFNIPPSQPQQVISKGTDFVKKFPSSRYNGSVYARLATSYYVLGDTQEMFDAAHEALQLNPDNVDVLSLMAYTIPRRVDPNNLDTPQKLQEATQDANHALDLLSKMQKPANLTQDQFTAGINAESASCHSGLGLVDYYQHDIPGMVSQLEQAVKLEAMPDPTDQFMLGVGYLQAGRPVDAEGIFEKCSAEDGPMASRCKTFLAQAKKQAAAAPATPAKP